MRKVNKRFFHVIIQQKCYHRVMIRTNPKVILEAPNNIFTGSVFHYLIFPHFGILI
jgi:hypothetical protein